MQVKTTAYYNEHDPFAVQWLRNLIAAGHLPPGDVDERDIQEVSQHDLEGYTQCHFFAGIGGWPLALRLAGWPDSRPVWTGSPPCQPFSNAGKQKGVDDDRHLWPAWFRLIRECRPPIVFGEQVASAIKHGWIDALQDEMEAENYAVGKIVLPACGVGAPHIRQRLFFVGVADANKSRRERTGWQRSKKELGTPELRMSGGMADSDRAGSQSGRETTEAARYGNPIITAGGPDRYESTLAPDSQWRAADWLFCRDGKWRPVEPGTFPLDSRIPARVGRLRGYGNAIVPQVAAAVIQAFAEIG